MGRAGQGDSARIRAVGSAWRGGGGGGRLSGLGPPLGPAKCADIHSGTSKSGDGRGPFFSQPMWLSGRGEMSVARCVLFRVGGAVIVAGKPLRCNGSGRAGRLVDCMKALFCRNEILGGVCLFRNFSGGRQGTNLPAFGKKKGHIARGESLAACQVAECGTVMRRWNWIPIESAAERWRILSVQPDGISSPNGGRDENIFQATWWNRNGGEGQRRRSVSGK